MSLRIFYGSVSIVTGGASGIGRALAEELACRGSEVILADLHTELMEEVASGIRDKGGKVNIFTLDVSDFKEVDTLLKKTVDRTGRLDYIFNNAGIGIGGPVELNSIEDWEKIINVNLAGVVNGVHASYRIMLKQGFGHIVNTASMAGLIPIPLLTSYSATKHAIVGLSRTLRIEGADSNIRVSTLCPGVINTPILDNAKKYGKMHADITPELLKKFKPMNAEKFAKKALNAIAKNRAIIIIPSRWKLLWWINRLSPTTGDYLTGRFYRNLKVSD